MNAPTTNPRDHKRYSPKAFNTDPEGLSDYKIKAMPCKQYHNTLHVFWTCFKIIYSTVFNVKLKVIFYGQFFSEQ